MKKQSERDLESKAEALADKLSGGRAGKATLSQDGEIKAAEDDGRKFQPIKIGEDNLITRSGSYLKANDALISTAKEAINKWHPTLKRAKIGFLFRDEAPTSKGRQTWGHASKVNDRVRIYTGLDFLIWIAKDVWDRLTSDRRLALIDHELCHCYMGPDGSTILGHDIEEFTAVIERHGFWTGDLMRVESLARGEQLKLFPEDEGGVFAVDPSGAKSSDA